ncbi:MAG: hypothetical protein AMXMBFR13_35920 [Phycisphaerae bacterium]
MGPAETRLQPAEVILVDVEVGIQACRLALRILLRDIRTGETHLEKPEIHLVHVAVTV